MESNDAVAAAQVLSDVEEESDAESEELEFEDEDENGPDTEHPLIHDEHTLAGDKETRVNENTNQWFSRVGSFFYIGHLSRESFSFCWCHYLFEPTKGYINF